MLDVSQGTGAFERLYRRVPAGLARVLVAAAAGAIVAIGVALRQNGGLGRRYWIVFAVCGFSIGIVGGALLGVLERRQAAGQAPPLWWTIFSRVAVTMLQVVGLALFLWLAWLMFRVARENHLYGL